MKKLANYIKRVDRELDNTVLKHGMYLDLCHKRRLFKQGKITDYEYAYYIEKKFGYLCIDYRDEDTRNMLIKEIQGARAFLLTLCTEIHETSDDTFLRMIAKKVNVKSTRQPFFNNYYYRLLKSLEEGRMPDIERGLLTPTIIRMLMAFYYERGEIENAREFTV